LGDEEKARIKRQIDLDVEASLRVGSRELWHRLYEAVEHMADRLAAYKVTDDGVEHPFRDTVVTNLVKLVDVLPKLNVTRDPELDRLAEQVRASLLVDPQGLRQSDSVRTETAKRAAEIASKMAGYMAGNLCPSLRRGQSRRGRVNRQYEEPNEAASARILSPPQIPLLLRPCQERQFNGACTAD